MSLTSRGAIELTDAESLPEEPRDDTTRTRVGSFFLWATFVAGLAANAVELYMAVDGLLAMAGGSCSAALIGLYFGLPVSALGLVLFIPGALLVGRRNPRAVKFGIAGVVMSVLALPFWYVVAGVLSSALNLG